MKKSSLKSIIIVPLFTATIISFAGSIGGAIAWYAYVTRATFSYQGTAISDTVQLQMGLESDEPVTGLNQEIINGTSYYFADPGVGLTPSNIISYCTNIGYATTKLSPVTSRYFDDTDGNSFALFEPPTTGVSGPNETTADISKYLSLPLVFRVIETNSGGDSYAKNQPIWITHSTTIPLSSSDGEVYKAIRIHVDGENKFILNPSSEELSASYNKVSGLLNLNNDDYFDYTYGVNPEEIIYGDYSGSGAKTKLDNDSLIDDINGSGIDDEITTFVAKHKAYVNSYSSLDGINSRLAHYETFASIAPDVDINSHLSNGMPVCITENSDEALGFATLTIYIEGWDFSVVNSEINHAFNLGLTFEINKV